LGDIYVNCFNAKKREGGSRRGMAIGERQKKGDWKRIRGKAGKEVKT
jgi:hypothetical protein